MITCPPDIKFTYFTILSAGDKQKMKKIFSIL